MNTMLYPIAPPCVLLREIYRALGIILTRPRAFNWLVPKKIPVTMSETFHSLEISVTMFHFCANKLSFLEAGITSGNLFYGKIRLGRSPPAAPMGVCSQMYELQNYPMSHTPNRH